MIIEKSALIINKKGMAGTTLSDIMDATKLAKGGIYGNFQSKDEIYVESFFYLTQSLSDTLDTIAEKGKTAKEKLFSLLDFYKGNKPAEGGCPLLNFGVEADDTHPEMKAHVKMAIRASQKRIFNIIMLGIAEKEVSPDIHPKNFSLKVFATIEGAILCRRVFASDDQMNLVIDSIKQEFEIYLM